MYSDNRVTPQTLEQARKDASLAVPSTLKSTSMEFAEAFTAVPRFAFDTISALQGLPATNPLDDSFRVFHKAMETPRESWGQETADFFATGIGYLNPMSGATIKPTIQAVEGAGSYLSRQLPEAAQNFLKTPFAEFQGFLGKFMPKTVGSAGKHLAKSMALGTELSVPESFIDSYDEKTGKFDIPGASSQAFSNGVLTLALDAVPVAIGSILGRRKKIHSKDYEHPMPGETHLSEEYDSALELGHISAEEHDLLNTYAENPNDSDKLKALSMKILSKQEYPLDHSSQKMIMSLLKKEHYEDFHTGMLDQISSGASEEFKSSVSDYVAASGMDFMAAKNEKFLDGINGYIDHMDKRLKYKQENLKKFENIKKQENFEHFDDNHPMSQKNVLKELSNVNHDTKKIPHSLSNNMKFRLKQEQDILKLKQSISDLKKVSKKDSSLLSKIDEKTNKLNELKNSRAKLLTPSHEIKKLEEHFINKDKLPENYQMTGEYHRLLDLSHFSKRADALLHHIDLKSKYEEQEAYHNMVSFLSDIIGSNVSKFADPERVVNYLKNKNDKMGHGVKSMKEPIISDAKKTFEQVESEAKENLTHDTETLKDNQTDIDRINSPVFDEMYQVSKERYEQFKNSEDILSQLISCERGDNS